ncbi:hypothetical protein OQX63_21790 [Pedobacter sp. PF22-3]|uniref:hypothetical protein n=1 Tax=Pedobacter sp. PF22-3 TaxID=2994467 RepID=UPI0022453EDD|nr:hypothetical protein [Pedobacter sp. PF22-3]MCX2496143.1 hypothetical protein [Pedobacter sp. PF22-3]
MANYRLNLNQQANGNYEVHEAGCRYYPEQNYDYLGVFSYCTSSCGSEKKACLQID